MLQQQGAATTVYVATFPELADVGGMYFNNCWVCEPSPLAKDTEFCEKVYQLGEQTILSKMGADAFETDSPIKDPALLFDKVSADNPSTNVV